jgi:hypothetical protein
MTTEFIKIELNRLISIFNSKQVSELGVIEWASPVIYFGNLANSKIATVGINPSNLEFQTKKGEEITGQKRRFHTLKSLELSSWSKLNDQHIEAIADYCSTYFIRNPYDYWFKQLDYLIQPAGISYYFPSLQACHLDIIPFATAIKWRNLSSSQRMQISENLKLSLGELINSSKLQALVLNGQSVVDFMEELSNNEFKKKQMKNWTLKRKETKDVIGYSYSGAIDSIGSTKLNRKLKVYGYNHNIQSSYGVSKTVHSNIRDWVSQKISGIV